MTRNAMKRGRILRMGAVLALGLGTVAVVSAPAGAAGDSLTLTPSSGPVGATVNVAGQLDCPDQAGGGELLVGFVDPDAGFQTRTNLDEHAARAADGSFDVAVTVPTTLGELQPGVGVTDVAVVPGVYTIQVQCTVAADVPNTVDAPFTVTAAPTTTAPTTTAPTTAAPTTTAPTTTAPAAPEPFVPPTTPPSDAVPFATAPPASVATGAVVPIDEGGFGAGESVTAVLYSSPQVLAQLTADPSGVVQGSVTIPAGTPEGQHTLALFGATQIKGVALQIAAETRPPASARTAVDTLPATGPSSSVVWMTAAGIGSIVVGLALTARHRVARRKA